MSKKVLKNLVFLLSLCLFLSIFFFEKRKSHIKEIEIKYKNNNKEYINEVIYDARRPHKKHRYVDKFKK